MSALALQGGGAGAAPNGSGVPNQADISVKQRSTLTAQEMVKAGNDYFKNMNETMKRIASLQEQSKRQKDIIRLNCVTDKLVRSARGGCQFEVLLFGAEDCGTPADRKRYEEQSKSAHGGYLGWSGSR